ncbi:MAG: hypothetical protein J07HB67_00293, partial [halophilic archaeon J07HB67]
SFVVTPLVVAVLETVEYVLTHGSMSYQRRDGTLVAYDRLTDTPQWATPIGGFRRAELSDGRLADRLFDSQTLTVIPTGVDDELSLAHLQSAARVATVFDLPLATTEYDPFRLRFAGVVVTLAVVTIAVELLLSSVVLEGDPASILLVLLPFVVPMTVFGFEKLWNRAY